MLAVTPTRTSFIKIHFELLSGPSQSNIETSKLVFWSIVVNRIDRKTNPPPLPPKLNFSQTVVGCSKVLIMVQCTKCKFTISYRWIRLLRHPKPLHFRLLSLRSFRLCFFRSLALLSFCLVFLLPVSEYFIPCT